MTKQRPAFWALQLYIFLEYFRPQQIYEWLAFFPWSFVTLTIACILFLFESRQRGKMLYTDWLLLAFTLAVLASSIFAIDPSLSFDAMDRYILWVPLYILISRLANSEERVLLMIGAWLLWNAKMAVGGAISWASCGFCYRGWGIIGTPGPFNEASDFAIEMIIVFTIGVWLTYGMWPRLTWPRRFLLGAVPAAALLCILGSNTRGSLLGLAFAVLTMVLSSERRLRMLSVGFVVCVVVVIALPKESLARFDSAGTDETSMQRLTYWRRGLQMASERPLLGIGYNNWLPYYRERYHERGHVQHNIFIQAVSEVGYIGLILFTLLAGSTFVLNFHTRRLLKKVDSRARLLRSLTRGFDAALVGYLVAGFFLTVLYYPFFWVTLSFVVATHMAARFELQRYSPVPVRPKSIGSEQRRQYQSRRGLTRSGIVHP